jgi:hypothetical protein
MKLKVQFSRTLGKILKVLIEEPGARGTRGTDVLVLTDGGHRVITCNNKIKINLFSIQNNKKYNNLGYYSIKNKI